MNTDDQSREQTPVVRRPLRRTRDAWQRFRAAVRPGRQAWRGATLGTAAATTVALAALGTMLRTGRGLAADVVLAVVAGWVVVLIVAGLLLGLGRLVRGVPPRLRALGFAAVVFIGAFFAVPGGLGGVAVAAVFVVAGAFIGAGVIVFARRPDRRSTRVVAAGGLAVGALAAIAIPVWLWSGAGDPPGPAVTPGGPYEVATFTYGSGQHPHRAVFGEDVDVVTPTVDGTAFLESWTGLWGALRTRYWGFGPDAFPLNAQVWAPVDADPGPLVLVVHGNHAMEYASDEGYAWLAEDLASRGYVVASVDQNFLNLSITRGFDLGDEGDARAWVLLEHLKLWREWDQDGSALLHGVADLDRIALIGHSRGGEAAAHAAHLDGLTRYPEDARVTLDAGFGIDGVVAIAPTDGSYRPAGRYTPLHDVSYLVLQGGRDGDVSSFIGLRQYARTSFSGEHPALKSAVYLEDANHGQFNTAWGRRDLWGIVGRTLETGALMTGDAQRRDAQTAIVGFLEAVLREDLSGLEPLRDGSHPAWTGETRVLVRHERSAEFLISDFDEDNDPETTTLAGGGLAGTGLATWREEPAPLRWGDQHTNGVVLGWEDGAPASFTISLPDDIEFPPDPVLILDVASTATDPPGDGGTGDTIAFRVTVNGTSEPGHIVEVPATPQPRRVKTPLPDIAPEPLDTTMRISLADGDGAEPPREIHLVFDQTTAGEIQIERIAFGSD